MKVYAVLVDLKFDIRGHIHDWGRWGKSSKLAWQGYYQKKPVTEKKLRRCFQQKLVTDKKRQISVLQTRLFVNETTVYLNITG